MNRLLIEISKRVFYTEQNRYNKDRKKCKKCIKDTICLSHLEWYEDNLYLEQLIKEYEKGEK